LGFQETSKKQTRCWAAQQTSRLPAGCGCSSDSCSAATNGAAEHAEIKLTCIDAIALSLSLNFCSCSFKRTDFGSKINLQVNGCPENEMQ